jgi:SRSO17 transposase
VYLVYVGARGHAMIDRELYLPSSWTEDPQRRDAAGVPDDITFLTKPALATGVPREQGIDPLVEPRDRRLQMGGVLQDNPISRVWWSAKRPCNACRSAGIFLRNLPLVSGRGHAFIDRALYLPRRWTDDPQRCAQAGVPAERGFATKPELVIDMLVGALAAGVVLRYFTADTGYGWLYQPELDLAHIS